MNLKEQLYIATIADCRSITRAAERLHISQPALSSYISGIEDNIGVKLFNRYSKEVVPTYSGELYIHAAKKMLLLKAEFDEMLSDLRGGERGRIRIGMQIRRSPFIIPAFYREFHEMYPKVEISFAEGVIERLEEMLADDELDLVLCNKVRETKGFEYIKIADERLLLAMSRAHPLVEEAKRLPEYPRDWIDLRLFSGETFILQRSRQSQRNFSDHLMKVMKVAPGQIIEIQNIETSTRMAALGAGVSFVLETYLKNFRFDPAPAAFLVGEGPGCVEFVAVRKKDSYIPSYMDTAIEIIRKNL